MKFTFAPEAQPLAGYTIKRAIDRGAFGEVYFALSDSGKQVALKLLRDNPEIELRGVSQCLNLKHPHLVTIFDVRTDGDGDSWIIMEYLSGKSLEQVLAEHPRGLPPQEVWHWLSGVSAGIGYLHAQGIVHRDLKPANIFCEGEFVKVGDVGLSKFIKPSRRSAHTESVGTVYYMAPEVARGKYGRELDVYSLGIITYEMLTGGVPFNGESTGEILMKHLTARPDLAVLPAPFRACLANALEKDPLRRTVSVQKFAEEFQTGLRQWQRLQQGLPEVFLPESSAPLPAVPPGERATSAAIALPRDPAKQHSPAAGHVVPQTAPVPALANDRCVRGGAGGADSWIFTRLPSGPVLVSIVLAVSVLAAKLGPSMFSRPFTWSFVPILLVLGFVVYRGVVAVTNRILDMLQGPPPPLCAGAGAFPAATTAPVVSRGLRTATVGPSSVRDISPARRAEDICLSLARATFWTAVFVLGGLILNDGTNLSVAPFTNSAQATVFALTTWAASWVLLLLCKLWEGKQVSPQGRRLCLGLAGLAVGAFAWVVAESQFVTLGEPTRRGIFDVVGAWSLRGEHNSPSLAGYMVFFGVFFALRRWWMQTDSFRAKRFRWTSWWFTWFVGLLIPAAFAFPGNWAGMWAAAISAVVQLSAGWTPPEQRTARRLSEGVQAGGG